MSAVASVKIEEWGNKFVVVGQFKDMSVITSKEFQTYQDALSEMVKTVAREQLRYESGLRSRSAW